MVEGKYKQEFLISQLVGILKKNSRLRFNTNKNNNNKKTSYSSSVFTIN